MDLAAIGLLLGLVGLLLWSASRHNEIFRVIVKKGRITKVRGRVPPPFMRDLREITQYTKDGCVRAVREGGEGRIEVSSSIDERTAQRLRNAYAIYPSKRL